MEDWFRSGEKIEDFKEWKLWIKEEIRIKNVIN